MSISIDLYEDTGVLTSGRGATQTIVDQWNLKNSADPAVVYFPTAETTNAPLVRPTAAGQEFLSFKKYITFKVYGTYAYAKNLRISLSANSATQASAARLFYKFTNTYAAPDAAYDGAMMCAALDSTIQVPTLFPMFGTSPSAATSRSIVYGPNATLWTNFLVLQMRIPAGCTVGNSAEFLLTLSADEY